MGMSQPKIQDKENHFSYGLDIGRVVCEHTGFDEPSNQPDRYAVYVLECEGYDSNGYDTDEKFKKDWEYWASAQDFDGYDPYEPERWAWAAYYADRVFYVGQTNSLHQRLLDHQSAPEATSIFNVVFQPMCVETVEWVSTRKQSLELEKEVADEYSDRSKGWFSYYA